MSSRRNLIILLGDQLDEQAEALKDADPNRDVIWMAEVREEAEHVWCSKIRMVLFLSAMRHFRDALRDRGFTVLYRNWEEGPTGASFAEALKATVADQPVQKLIVTHPGEWRVLQQLQQTADALGLPLDVLSDPHFFCTPEDFGRHAEGRKSLRMEYFYREMRRKHQILMDDGEPAGGSWNFDKENREPFGRKGPTAPPPLTFKPDDLTREVIALVEKVGRNHPGNLDHFNWPVTRAQALHALSDFVQHRLPDFGRNQDAMWTDEPFLHHSLIASSLNLKLLQPLEVVQMAEAAYRRDPDRYPISAVEGFIRQILGWREYVRGVYWLHMPDYLERNGLGATADLPDFYWTGETEMVCMRQAIEQTLDHGYAHHIQRLMVTGLFSLMLGVDPKKVHAWYLAVYVDAVEWVELPNTLGMSQYADNGVMASKPYIASGNYIQRMSNYCSSCRFNPKKRIGEDACPFTTLYWDFLQRHRTSLAKNPRMGFQIRNLNRVSPEELNPISERADWIRNTMVYEPTPKL